MRNLTKLILASISQVIFDWVGFQFLDEAKRLVESPSVAVPIQGYVGLIAIVGATVLLCYLVFLIHSSRRTFATELKSVFPRTFGDTMDRLQEQAEKNAIDKLSKLVIVMPSFGLSPYSHLTLHLSRSNDTPQKPHRPYYIVNHSENMAFWAPEFILKLANTNWIQWISHNGERALQEYLSANKIKLNERYPTIYKRDLGISLTDLSEKLVPSSLGQPQLIVTESEIKPDQVETLEFRFANGERRYHEVRFYYIKIRNDGPKSVDDVTLTCQGNQMLVIPSTSKSSFGIDVDENQMSAKEFDERPLDNAINLLLRDRKKLKDSIKYVHPSSEGVSFVLFFTIEGINDRLLIPAYTKVWYNAYGGFKKIIHGSKNIKPTKVWIHVRARDMKQLDVGFEAVLRNWRSFDVKQLNSTS